MNGAGAAFYAEDLNVSLDIAEKVSWAIAACHGSKAIEKRTVWAAHGFVRVYFSLWSQNSIDAIRGYNKCYYDAARDDIFVSGYFYGRVIERPFSDIVNMSAQNFSGAKTRAAIREFSEVFYEQKANRD